MPTNHLLKNIERHLDLPRTYKVIPCKNRIDWYELIDTRTQAMKLEFTSFDEIKTFLSRTPRKPSPRLFSPSELKKAKRLAWLDSPSELDKPDPLDEIDNDIEEEEEAPDGFYVGSFDTPADVKRFYLSKNPKRIYRKKGARTVWAYLPNGHRVCSTLTIDVPRERIY